MGSDSIDTSFDTSFDTSLILHTESMGSDSIDFCARSIAISNESDPIDRDRVHARRPGRELFIPRDWVWQQVNSDLVRPTLRFFSIETQENRP